VVIDDLREYCPPHNVLIVDVASIVYIVSIF